MNPDPVLTCFTCGATEEMPEPGTPREVGQWRRSLWERGWRWAKIQEKPPVFMPRTTRYSCPSCPLALGPDA